MALKRIIKKLRFIQIENYVYEGVKSDLLFKLPEKFDLRIFDLNNSSGINIIERNKSKNNICYAVFKNNELAHFTWVHKKNLLLKQLGFDKSYFSVASFTYPAYRGLNIYPFILQFLVHKYQDNKIVGFVDKDNQPSIRAFLKAGFTCTYRFKLVRFLGLRLYIRKYAC